MVAYLHQNGLKWQGIRCRKSQASAKLNANLESIKIQSENDNIPMQQATLGGT